jgi:threonine/homoserine/homoserine lactone efflux protein
VTRRQVELGTLVAVGPVIADLLPLAIGVAISPIPIIAVILMLLSRQAARTSTGFLTGWLAGIVVVTVVVLLVVGQAGNTASGKPSTASSIIKLLLGAALLLMAARQWRTRPHDGETGTMPKWMSAIDSFNFGKALELGFLLSALNPKNLILCVGAGTTIGSAHLPGGQDAIAVVLFTALAGCSVAIPVIAYLAAQQKMAAPLDRLRTWLIQNNAAVMAVVLLVLGVALIGKGIGGLTA